MKFQCVKIVNDKLTNIRQKESASNTVSLAAIKQTNKLKQQQQQQQQQHKKNKTKKETMATTTTVKTILLKQMRLLFRQGLSTFSWLFRSRFVEGATILYVLFTLVRHMKHYGCFFLYHRL